MKDRFSGPRREHGKQARENRHVRDAEKPEKTMPALDEDELMALIAEHEVPFVLILDCVQDPHNLGAILRTADAAGVHAVFHYVPLHSSPAGRKFGRTAGALPVTEDLAERLVRLPLFFNLDDAAARDIAGHVRSFFKR